MRWLRTVSALLTVVLVLAIGFAALRSPSVAFAGAVLIATLFGLTVAVLTAVYRRGAGRAFWLGFAFLGWGYMTLAADFWWDREVKRPALVTTALLDWLRAAAQDARASNAAPPQDGLHADSLFMTVLGAGDAKTRAIHAALDQPLSMPFSNATPLEDILKYIDAATQSAQLPDGIPIYVDPFALEHARVSITSRVVLNLEGVPLKTTLRLILAQLQLGYHVKDGLLRITGEDATLAFHQTGHCLIALVVAAAGGLVGRFLWATERSTDGVAA